MIKEIASDVDKRKIELVLMRIKNNFYQKEEVLEKVATEILNTTQKKDTTIE